MIVKEILHLDGAREAVRHGIQGIVVSCHDGRQLDISELTVEALSDITRAVRREEEGCKMDVYVDGGSRRGTSVLKALVSGATPVMVGGPIL